MFIYPYTWCFIYILSVVTRIIINFLSQPKVLGSKFCVTNSGTPIIRKAETSLLRGRTRTPFQKRSPGDEPGDTWKRRAQKSPRPGSSHTATLTLHTVRTPAESSRRSRPVLRTARRGPETPTETWVQQQKVALTIARARLQVPKTPHGETIFAIHPKDLQLLALRWVTRIVQRRRYTTVTSLGNVKWQFSLKLFSLESIVTDELPKSRLLLACWRQFTKSRPQISSGLLVPAAAPTVVWWT